MQVVLPRKIYEPGGFAYEFLGGKCKPLASNVAALSRDAYGRLSEVTWEEVMEARRERQAKRLDRIRSFELPSILPCYIWTFFNRQDIPYHGWYCYVVTRHFDISVNFRVFKHDLARSIMLAVPLGFLPIKENFDDWMELFAKKYPRKPTADRRKAGSLVGWVTDKETFTLTRPCQKE